MSSQTIESPEKRELVNIIRKIDEAINNDAIRLAGTPCSRLAQAIVALDGYADIAVTYDLVHKLYLIDRTWYTLHTYFSDIIAALNNGGVVTRPKYRIEQCKPNMVYPSHCVPYLVVSSEYADIQVFLC